MAKTNSFINPDAAEPRHVLCGNCGAQVMGHWQGCPACKAKFHANMHGYARLCKNPNCCRTEMAGHPHALCRMHHEQRKQRQAHTAMQPNCRCGNKAPMDHDLCSRCQGEEDRCHSEERQRRNELRMAVEVTLADLFDTERCRILRELRDDMRHD